MKLVTSKQKDVAFIFCPHPITIDKRSEWGDSSDNVQLGPNGAFLKMASPSEVSHMVQPNADKSAPVGWVPGSNPVLFDKQPIWVDDEILSAGQTVRVVTLDGPIDYTAKEDSLRCFNGSNVSPDYNDGWVQTVTNLCENYNMNETLED